MTLPTASEPKDAGSSTPQCRSDPRGGRDACRSCGRGRPARVPPFPKHVSWETAPTDGAEARSNSLDYVNVGFFSKRSPHVFQELIDDGIDGC
jgi:hypothetical protein